ncbi:MAG: histidine kinase [Kineosporiaceae bacterium]
MARNVTAVVFAALAFVAVVRTLVEMGEDPPLWRVVLLVVVVLALMVLQVGYFSSTRPLAESRRPLLALGVQAALCYAPFLVFGQSWVGMPGFLAGSILLVMPTALGWSGFALVILSMAAIQTTLSVDPADITYTTVSTVITGLVVFGLSRLASLVRQLHDARDELARMAVSAERLRFARDLHDLLGYSLSAITLKSELTRRLVTRQPARAVDELTEILQLSRQALADVRSVAAGYRDMSLDSETRSACSVLAAADIRVECTGRPGPLPDAVNTVLATVLREGVTNVLRHSKATTCRVVVERGEGRVRLLLTNDGVGEGDHLALQKAGKRHGGSGITNLRSRVEALGGRLDARVDDDGWFELDTDLPLAVPVQPDPVEADGGPVATALPA